jgi:hypothetical protein
LHTEGDHIATCGTDHEHLAAELSLSAYNEDPRHGFCCVLVFCVMFVQLSSTRDQRVSFQTERVAMQWIMMIATRMWGVCIFCLSLPPPPMSLYTSTAVHAHIQVLSLAASSHDCSAALSTSLRAEFVCVCVCEVLGCAHTGSSPNTFPPGM